jgi:hypothetical protein
VNLPIEDRQWGVGLIVGPSGSGKSTILNHCFGGERAITWGGDGVVDDFPAEASIEVVQGVCSAVGFNTIPAYLRPFQVLSNGEQFRVTMARRLLESTADAPIVVDEFTSVVDRQVAKIGAHAVQKWVRRNHRQFIAATCHYDVIDWLQPDWTFEPATRMFSWRSVQPRPSLPIRISKVAYPAWSLFAPFHYLTRELNKAAQCYVLFAGEEETPAAFGGVLHRPNYNKGPQSSTYGNNGLSGGYSSGSTRISHALRAMERAGLIRTLAEPNLTAVSGESANFLAGGEFPVPLVDSDGKLTVSFKKFGVGLAFTPVVMTEGRISLKIDTEVSELTNEGAVVLSNISIPALKTRQARSTVELPSGGSLAIAGLLSDSTRQNIDGFPGLKDVPVLGTMFRSRDYIKQETELVVIVTPYMVRPTARQNLARPDDGLAAASDLKATFLGHINRIYGRGRELPPGGLKGDYGFIVE